MRPRVLQISLALSTVTPGAGAEPIDPTIAQRIALPAASDALPQLPTQLDVLWQARLQGSIAHAPAVTSEGRMIVASAGRITQLDRTGKTDWSYRLGGASAAAPPAITPAGARLVVTTTATLLSLTNSGDLAAEAPLPLSTNKPVVGPYVSARHAAIVLAAGPDVVVTSWNGDLVARVDVGSDVVAIAELDDAYVLTTRFGAVLRWTPGVDLRHLGAFGGTVHQSVLAGRRHLFAVVESSRLIELDLASGTTRTRAADANALLADPPTPGPNRSAHVVEGGFLVTYDERGTEQRRVLLAPAAAGSSQSANHVPMIAGSGGRIGFALSSGDVGVVSADGQVLRAPVSVCRDPRALVSVGDSRFAVVCASGLILALGT